MLNRPPVKEELRGSNWECPHCGVRVFTNSLSWHLYMRHDINLSTPEYSREIHQWKREGTHTDTALGLPRLNLANCPLALAYCPRAAAL